MALDPTSRNRSNSFDVTWEELAGWTPEQMQDYLANLSEEVRADFQTNFNDDAHDDIEAGNDSIEELIKRIRRETRRESPEKKAEGEALIALLEQHIDAESERIEGVRDAVSDAFTTYNETHIDAQGRNVNVSTRNPDEPLPPEVTYELGRTAGGTVEEDLFDQGLFSTENGIEIDDLQAARGAEILNNQGELINGNTQADLEAFLAQRQTDRLNARQQVAIHLNPGDEAWQTYDENTGTTVIHITESDGTEHILTFLNSSEAIFVYDGGELVDAPQRIMKVNLDLNLEPINTIGSKNDVTLKDVPIKKALMSDATVDFSMLTTVTPAFMLKKIGADAPRWDDHSLLNTYLFDANGGLDTTSLWEHEHPAAGPVGGQTGNSAPTTYRPEGYQDMMGALDTVEEVTEVPQDDRAGANLQEDYQATVDGVYEFLEEHADGNGGYNFTADDARELWQEIISNWPSDNDERADRAWRVVVAFFMKMDRSLFGRLFRPAITLLEDPMNPQANQVQEKLAIIILETYAGPGAYPLNEGFAHTNSEDELVQGDWGRHDRNIRALDWLEQILQQDGQELPAELQTARTNEEAAIQYAEEHADFEPGDPIHLTDEQYDDMIDLFWDDPDLLESDGDLSDVTALKHRCRDLLKGLRDGSFETPAEMAQYIIHFFKDILGPAWGRAVDDLAAAFIIILYKGAPEILDLLKEVNDPDFVAEMNGFIYNTGGDPANAGDASTVLGAPVGTRPTGINLVDT